MSGDSAPGLVVDAICRRGVGPVSFEAEPGEFVAINGPASSGKSTLAGIVAGFVKPDKGRVLLDGVDLHSLDDADLGRRVGWLGAVIPGPRRKQRTIPPLIIGDDVEAPFVVEQEFVPFNVLAAQAERRRLDERLVPLLATIRFLCDQGAAVVVATTHRVLVKAADTVVRL